MDALIQYGLLALAMFAGLFGVGVLLINRMAAKPQIDGWDKVKEVTDQIAPHLDAVVRWANPDSNAVPPTPSNPDGVG